MRAKISVQVNGNVLLEYDCPYMHERTFTMFTCRSSGGYVRDANTMQQICDGLQNRGNTLWCHTNEQELANLIRKEYRKFKAIAKKDLSA